MTAPNAAPSVNVILLLRDHLPHAIREAKQHINDMEAKLVVKRAELETLVRHAAVEGLAVAPSSPVEAESTP